MADALKNDGAAFRLLVAKALSLNVDPEDKSATAVGWGGIVCSERFANKAGALPAARRAVVNAAAEVDRRYTAGGVRACFKVGDRVMFRGIEHEIFANGDRPGTFDICQPGWPIGTDRWLNVPPGQLTTPGVQEAPKC